MLDKKITKEISNLLTSSDKARKAISAEIDKIDAKYKALAEKEKSKLSKMLKSIEEQMESYKTLLGLGDEVELDETESTAVEEEEKVVDNLFPENNIEKAVDEFVVENDPTVIDDAVSDNDEYISEQEIGLRKLHFPDENIIIEKADETVSDEKEDHAEDGDDEDEWPAFPEEWK